MQIRFGYELTVQCEQPTPMVCLMEIRPERRGDLVAPERLVSTPAVPTHTYLDMFGNVCRRFTAPAGEFSLSADAVVSDPGTHDPTFPDAAEIPVQDLPDECLAYLLGSRYCETDRLSQVAWDRFENVDPGWSRVQAICDFVHDHLTFDYMKARATRTALEAYDERVGVCRDYAHLAITLCRCMNIPARYVNGPSRRYRACRSSTRWISPPGWRSISAAAGTFSTRATTCPVSAASSSPAAATPPMSR